MPARGSSSGRIPGAKYPGQRVKPVSGNGTARQTSSGKWVSNKAKGIYKAQKAQNTSATTYKTTDANRSAAAKKAAATRKANAATAAREAARSNKAKGRRQGVKVGLPLGAAAGAAVSYATSKGSEGPKKSVPVKRKKK